MNGKLPNKLNMKITDKIILITGANRGLGQALVQEALNRGAKKVYAGTRVAINHPDKRVIPLNLDVTNIMQIREAVDKIDKLDVLINNAGVAFYDDLSDSSILEKHLVVNLYGTQNVTNAFLPVLKDSEGAIVNILSILALAPLPPIASYCISKAAAFSMTQSLRAFLKSQSVSVHAVLTGPIDTDMSSGLDVPKASPEYAAQSIFDGIENQQEDIFPDPMSALMEQSWNTGGAKAMERQNAMAVQA
jgi:NAD(P)-dependent dehydrogenase (short-subunit alcohol dehydrogenase family)